MDASFGNRAIPDHWERGAGKENHPSSQRSRKKERKKDKQTGQDEKTLAPRASRVLLITSFAGRQNGGLRLQSVGRSMSHASNSLKVELTLDERSTPLPKMESCRAVSHRRVMDSSNAVGNPSLTPVPSAFQWRINIGGIPQPESSCPRLLLRVVVARDPTKVFPLGQLYSARPTSVGSRSSGPDLTVSFPQ